MIGYFSAESICWRFCYSSVELPLFGSSSTDFGKEDPIAVGLFPRNISEENVAPPITRLAGLLKVLEMVIDDCAPLLLAAVTSVEFLFEIVRMRLSMKEDCLARIAVYL